MIFVVEQVDGRIVLTPSLPCVDPQQVRIQFLASVGKDTSDVQQHLNKIGVNVAMNQDPISINSLTTDIHRLHTSTYSHLFFIFRDILVILFSG